MNATIHHFITQISKNQCEEVIEEKSIADPNNVTAATFSHTSNEKRENSNATFTGEKLDKFHELVEAVKNLTINDAKYYESNIATARDAHGDLTCNPERVTHTINENEAANHTSNNNFEQQLLSNRTIPVVVLMVNPNIEQMIAPIVLEPHMLSTLSTKEVVVDADLGGTWVNMTPQ